MKPTLKVALIALVFTYLFFFEYLSPFRWVNVSYDLDGFHYPLMDYGFRALKEGRFPQWDITFSGISYAGNPQTALFYPPTWILFAANWRHEHLSYTSLETFVIAHIWLTFVLGYLWLRYGRKVGEFPAFLGAAVLAYSGFLCTQMQHLGLIVTYAWSPLALLAIDRFTQTRGLRPVLLCALALALAFLGGYTPSWAVLAIFLMVYAVSQGQGTGFAALGALALSLLLAMVQLLPTLYLLNTKIPDYRYGGGMGLPFLVSYLIPNFYDFAMSVPAGTNFPNDYVYLGAPGLFGVAYLVTSRRIRGALALYAALAVCLVLFLDPFGLIAPVIEKALFLRQVCRSYYFAAGITMALAALAAHGLDAFFERERRMPNWTVPVFLTAALGWGALELLRWRTGHFTSGWSYESSVTLAIFTAGAFLFRSQPKLVGVALVFCTFADYKAFGTSKRFNATAQHFQIFTPTGFLEMDDQAYQEMKRHPEFRVLSDVYLNPLQLRHFNLATPQGFDPFYPQRYDQELHARNAEFRSNWEFGVAPENIDLLQHLGVRYWITIEASPLYPKLKALPRFQELGKEPRYFRVFSDSQSVSVADNAEVLQWTPEYRQLRVTGPRKLTLAENRLMVWEAFLDGQSWPITPDNEFQSVAIPEGSHTLELRYQTKGLVAGAWISGLSAISLALIALRSRNART